MKFHKAKTWVTAAAAAAVVLLAAACSVNPGASQLEAHTEEILQAWLTQPDETLRDLALPDGARTQEEMDAQEEELYARFEELFPREYFTDTGYESFRSTVLAGAMYHLRVGEGAMELTDLVPNGEEQTKDTWQWVAQVRMDLPEKEPQDISILVSVQEEGGKIASLRLDQQDAGQISAYFGDGPFLADDQVQEKIEKAEAEQQDAFDKMQTAQEEIDRLEEEREAGEDVASQLEEAQSQWDQEFERYSQAAQDAYEAGDTQVQSQPEEAVEGGFEAEQAEGGEEPPLLEEGGVEVEQFGGTEEPPLPEEGGVEVEGTSESLEKAAARLGAEHYQEVRNNVGLPVLDFYTETEVREVSPEGDAMILGASDYFLPQEEDKMRWIIGNTKELEGSQEGWLRNNCTIEARLVDGEWTAVDYSTGILHLSYS